MRLIKNYVDRTRRTSRIARVHNPPTRSTLPTILDLGVGTYYTGPRPRLPATRLVVRMCVPHRLWFDRYVAKTGRTGILALGRFAVRSRLPDGNSGTA